jgi:hypothetical protein
MLTATLLIATLQGTQVDAAVAQHSGSATPPAAALVAVRADRPPALDGRLDDLVWQSAIPVTTLVQSDPDEGEPVSEATEVRIVYDGSALYVGARLWDRDPGAVAQVLSRRDDASASDEFRLLLDTYHDHRTAFLFAVSAAGVQRDAVAGDDGKDFDESWDAVWKSVARVDSLGWTVEMRIPFSQLRFSSASEQVWGVRVVRWIQRKNELALFPFVPKTEPGVASRFAHLSGLRRPPPVRRVELLPYTVVRQTYHRPDEPGNPFDDGQTTFGGAGLDAKAGLGPNFTIDLTVNPDFGQVEVDPAYVNLTEFEQFLPEHRPFFVEGADIFKFGSTGGGINPHFDIPLYFYSRRIGRPPQGEPVSSGDFETMPENTTILAAAKLSGKTASGWSIGALEAHTASEYATVYDAATGTRQSDKVEPYTSYFLGRVKRDLRGGATTIGLLGTAVNRDLDESSLRFLNSSAVTGGLDFRHRWHADTFTFAASLGGSYIRGDTSAMRVAQRGADRYYQRPDARHIRYDATRTSLAGLSGAAYLNKVAGNWIWTAAGSTMSPGFEVNDFGFQERVDLVSTAIAGGRRWTKSGSVLRQAYANVAVKNGWNYDGDLIEQSISAYGFGRLRNFWETSLSLGYQPGVLDDRLTRGGPLARRAASWSATVEAYSDNRKPIGFYGYAYYSRNAAGGWYLSVLPKLTYRPGKSLSLSLGLEYDAGWGDAHFVTRISDSTATATLGRRYVFAGLRQRILDASLRVNATFSRSLSLQLYALPFTFIGDYQGFKELAARRTHSFIVYGRDNGSTITQSDGVATVDPDGPGPASSFTIDNPDFRSRSLRINGVLRWEYRPGSTIFLVWSQTRWGYFENSGAGLMGDLRQAMFLDRPTNVLLVKVNAWLRP